MQLADTLPQTIRRARERRGESREDVARRIGVDVDVVAAAESGTARLADFVEVCKGLGVRMDVRVGGRTETLVYPLDPEERRAIEENIDWFSRLEPAQRLRTMARHLEVARRLHGQGLRGHGR